MANIKYDIVDIRTIKNEKSGMLSFFEAERDIPMAIKRIYYITGADKDSIRGGHAHKESMQFIFCPYGAIKLILDDGKRKAEVVLDNPSKGLLLYPCLWRDIIWLEEKSVLCVAVSLYYNAEENDYIRDYREFLEYVFKNPNIT